MTGIEDRRAIEDLMIRYCAAIDGGDVEGVLACFTEDCRLESNIVGAHPGQGGVRMLAEQMAKLKAEGRTYRHFISNFRVEVNGDRGRVRCYLLDIVTIENTTELLTSGDYDCDVVRRGKGWLIETRRVHADRQFELPGLPKAGSK
jgi:3-phenylpropionate/cinnamic acid dioxygenase small subunit